MTDTERRKQRGKISQTEVVSLEDKSSDDRFVYLLDEFCGQEEAWTLLAPDNQPAGWYDGAQCCDIIPIWPNEEFSKNFLDHKAKKGWRCVPIPLDDWLDDVLPALQQAKYRISTFPVLGQSSFTMLPSELADELENHWKLFAKSLIT
ncbi:DUF2750 domain-containing protein [Parasulfitobacter algicola]|uniref:DUF2750 domain-containing protein n=1 Tax=Parasulfitobacter algicola TaxID=2614809 RepID=A0ABX2IZU1_9RHOB|nr:DUF2750 domain-containing protein [Sulfitobacter algicola]NSX56965.1 DUF2750 domain-containing protein [Sulfitobacter algicola]